MATTAELLVILQEQFKGWNVNGPRGLLHYLDTAHKILCQTESDNRVVFDTTTGLLPYLVTTAGTFHYNLPADCWKLSDVLVECGINGSLLDNLSYYRYGTSGLGSTVLSTGFRISATRKLEYVNVSGIRYIRVPHIRSTPCGESALAALTFTDDPGTTTTAYNIRYYKKPASLVSDSIPLEIEPPYDELCLLPAACKLIEGVQHGNYMEARNEILKTIKPLYWKECNSGEQGFDYDAEDRGY